MKPACEIEKYNSLVRYKEVNNSTIEPLLLMKLAKESIQMFFSKLENEDL
jgi:hypothetical protein